MTSPACVLFDCDGVLVDSEPLTQQVPQADFARYGLDIPAAQIGSLFVGDTMAGAMRSARQMGAALPDDWLPQIHARLYSRLAETYDPISGIHAVLDALDAACISYATCSNGPMAKMEVTLMRCALWDRFAGRTFSAHDCATSKPAPDVYLKAAAVMGRSPERCIVIEDSATGARAGRAAGMRCFGFAADTGPEKLAPHCDVIFDKMADLPMHLDYTRNQRLSLSGQPLRERICGDQNGTSGVKTDAAVRCRRPA